MVCKDFHTHFLPLVCIMFILYLMSWKQTSGMFLETFVTHTTDPTDNDNLDHELRKQVPIVHTPIVNIVYFCFLKLCSSFYDSEGQLEVTILNLV
jgi:hypothetical protein